MLHLKKYLHINLLFILFSIHLFVYLDFYYLFEQIMIQCVFGLIYFFWLFYFHGQQHQYVLVFQIKKQIYIQMIYYIILLQILLMFIFIMYIVHQLVQIILIKMYIQIIPVKMSQNQYQPTSHQKSTIMMISQIFFLVHLAKL